MKYRKDDIVIVNFPFSDLSISKKRPALIIANTKGENEILCQISTKKSQITDYEIFLSKDNIKGNLKLDSYISVDMIFTLHKSQIFGKIAQIDKTIKNKVNKKINELFLE